MPKVWWNYGYTRELIFFWTGCFLLLFTVFNSFCLKKLNKEVYEVPSLTPLLPDASVGRNLWHSFLYTSLIFFRLTLDFHKLKLKRIGYTIYILVINIAGTVCLAYLANYVIQH